MGSTPIYHSVLNVKAVVAAFNQEKALVGAFSVITNLRMELFGALVSRCLVTRIINLETMWKFPDDIMLNKPVICIQIIFTKLFLSITTNAQPTFDYGII